MKMSFLLAYLDGGWWFSSFMYDRSVRGPCWGKLSCRLESLPLRLVVLSCLPLCVLDWCLAALDWLLGMLLKLSLV